MNKQITTSNIKVPNKDLEALRLHFPHCFDKDGNFQLEKFKNNLTEKEINFSTESYGLDWLGKSYARLLASDPATTLLKADETHNSKPENANSENLLIKGDNLEVLKHLANAYYEQVKMIYIDPPYNTGKDGFTYQDDRKFSVKELQNLIGVDAEKAKRILDFTQGKSNSHSAWLTFLYPRLYISKQLLKDEGVIFVSIDDNEVTQLRMLMDEVFGEENYIGTFIINSTPNARDYGHIGKMHEYCIFYANKLNKTETNLLEDKNKRFTFKDEKGGFNVHPLYNSNVAFTPENRENLYYPFYLNPEKQLSELGEEFYEISLTKNENHIEIYPPKSVKDGVQFVWRWGQPKSLGELNKEIVGYLTEDEEYRIVQKMRTSEKLIRSILSDKEFSSRRGTAEVEKIFGKKVFSFPKPIELLNNLIKVATDKDSIVLDFFAGSGTTGDSLFQINSEDGGNRRFILVQIPELIDQKQNKVGYNFVKKELGIDTPTIFDITKERIIRAAKKTKDVLIPNKINEKEAELKELEGKLDLEGKEEKINLLKTEIESLKHQDLGFKVFETTPIWEDYNFEAEQFDTSQTLFDTGKLTEEDLKALLVTWKTNDNISLSHDLEIVDLGGYTAFYGNGKLYLLHKNFTTENLKAILEKIDTEKAFNPTSIIAFGYHFESKSLRELSENVKQYANKKKIDIDFITRY
ncbi:site-specific DNA-methyltransferase [Flavobacterium sp.]|uniref:site-specific DNA-methyltransferase n=1 Tax=Flavobacterium sp. TaxID=239 RepID=UPI003B9D2974